MTNVAGFPWHSQVILYRPGWRASTGNRVRCGASDSGHWLEWTWLRIVCRGILRSGLDTMSLVDSSYPSTASQKGVFAGTVNCDGANW